MKIIILGGTGMVGHTIALYLLKKAHDITVFSTKIVDFCKCIVGDILNFEKTRLMIIEGNYDVVINAIGILNQNAEENKALAILLNSYLPHFLSETLKDTKTKLIHMSTDCVFSGQKGSYVESDFTDGKTFYDRTKALGEVINSKDLTFRNSIIGPDINYGGIGLFNWFMRQEKELDGYSRALWTGVTTLTLAKALDQAIIEDITGLYHLVNNDVISKYDLLKLFNKHFKNNVMVINDNDNFEIDKSLLNTRRDFSFIVPSYEEMIIEMKNWIIENSHFYPHYEIAGIKK